MNEKTPEARQKLAAKIRDTGGEKENKRKFAPATERFRAIDLSCQCRRWVLGAELGLPVGASSVLHPQPPINH
mgnify:CR=1 FL=1